MKIQKLFKITEAINSDWLEVVKFYREKHDAELAENYIFSLLLKDFLSHTQQQRKKSFLSFLTQFNINK